MQNDANVAVGELQRVSHSPKSQRELIQSLAESQGSRKSDYQDQARKRLPK